MANRPKVFVTDDKFPDVIAALAARGWRRYPHLSFPKFDLKWSNYSKIAWKRVASHQIVNHFQNVTLFSQKDELAARLYRLPGEKVDGFYPRTFDMAVEAMRDVLRAWFLYYRAIGVVKAAVGEHVNAVDEELVLLALSFLERIVENDAFYISLRRSCANMSALAVHDPIWMKMLRTPSATTGTTHCSPDTVDKCCQLLRELQERDPHVNTHVNTGMGDIWICKPSNLSQGRGIQVMTSLEDILALQDTDPNTNESTGKEDENQDNDDQRASIAGRKVSWVVQKYVERPLLLQDGRKFDVRQWVLITSLEPLQVYWYHECYLRFCSSPFTLDVDQLSDQFVHLSNYSVQKNAKSQRKAFSPMWTSSQFQQHLRDQHGRDVWNDDIIPQMQHATRVAIQAVLPELRQVGRGFEWLGIDFLVDSLHRVWLLEVNVTPDVSHSTEVTAALVPPATQDTLEIVLDGEASSENRWILMKGAEVRR
ncbi:hypothetical protein Poli38472_007628 [Pythium oligandrum]|uniref:Tubulin-tyrosine ligase n=1 Tax=Pythium oligandrum TaxID=41045 RepID=A0A8K1CQH6_PYTOL|nr:hypothetical protein Poli38472_007628 [Pythium oligandrum]|eukprot:TMW67956.1 hypothetical protein Poli38472_007628 [Pythium oligandrum]